MGDEELNPDFLSFLSNIENMPTMVEHVSARLAAGIAIDTDDGSIDEIPTIAMSFNNEDFEDQSLPIYVLAVPVAIGMIMVLSEALNQLNINPLMAIDPPQEPSKNDL